MSQKYLQSRTPADLIEMGGDAFTLAISKDSGVAWRLRIMAHLKEGSRELGAIVTQPRASSGAPHARVIAAGSLPGARGWSVDALCLDVSGTDPNIELDLSVGTSAQVPNFTDLETRTRQVLTGVAAVVTLQPWQRLLGWTARAVAPGATVQVNAGPAVVVAAGTSAADNGLSIWGAAVTFVGTSEYIVEYEGMP
jgi:hypothetical protein